MNTTTDKRRRLTMQWNGEKIECFYRGHYMDAEDFKVFNAAGVRRPELEEDVMFKGHFIACAAQADKNDHKTAPGHATAKTTNLV